MAKYKRYEGEFLSRSDVRWRIEIWQENDFSFPVTELRFPADNPLTIEWKEGDTKVQPVLPSAATLTIVSDTDREFIDLYQVQVGAVRLDVYRENALYWSGTLDTEMYEEPYAYRDGYEVTVTFSDLAILDRLNYSKPAEKFLQMSGLIAQCIEISGINVSGIVEYISTTPQGGGSLTSSCYFVYENFFDEDDIPMTMREVLDTILQPFALRLTQHSGQIRLYDINSLYTSMNPASVEWMSTDSVLSVDKTYNNAELTFSPYMKNKLIDATINPESIAAGNEYPIRVDASGDNYEGFKVRLSTENNDVFTPAFGDLNLYRIIPTFSGDNEAGIAFQVRTGVVNAVNDISYTTRVAQVDDQGPDAAYPVLIKCKEEPYVYVDATNKDKYLLKVTTDLMLDFKLNPYESESEYNSESEPVTELMNIAYMAFRLRLKDSAGNVLYHYENKGVVMNSDNPLQQYGKWVAGDSASLDDAYFSFYDPDNHQKGTPFKNGFATNKHMLGFYRGDTLPKYYTFYPEGEVVPLPPVSGFLELSISSRIIAYMTSLGVLVALKLKYVHLLNWALLKDVKVLLIDQYGKELDETDVVMTSFVEREAREDMSVNTAAGTLSTTHPAARGQIFTASQTVINKFTRAGITGNLENMLCGTIYSQYKGRKRLLSGTVKLLNDFTTVTDENEPGKYLIVSETQNVISDESEIKMVELSEENYEGIEYE